MDRGAWWAAVHGVTKSWTHTTERFTFFSLSCIGEGNGSPLQCSCLENPRDGGAWWAAIYRVAQSRTRLKRLSSSSRGQTRNAGKALLGLLQQQGEAGTNNSFPWLLALGRGVGVGVGWGGGGAVGVVVPYLGWG